MASLEYLQKKQKDPNNHNTKPTSSKGSYHENLEKTRSSPLIDSIFDVKGT